MLLPGFRSESGYKINLLKSTFCEKKKRRADIEIKLMQLVGYADRLPHLCSQCSQVYM